MTPDRLQEIRQRLHSCDIGLIRHCAVEDITDLLAALATAEAQLTEARRQECEIVREKMRELGKRGLTDPADDWQDLNEWLRQRAQPSAQTEETR